MDFRKFGTFLVLIGGIGFVSALIWCSITSVNNGHPFVLKLFVGPNDAPFRQYSPVLVWISSVFIALGFAVKSAALPEKD
jgi:hypothetical protein